MLLIYQAETWAVKKVHEQKLKVADMRIRNEVIRDKFKVGNRRKMM